MIKFRLSTHTAREGVIVEVVEVNGSKEEVIACIYPEGALAIKIVSAHIASFSGTDGRGTHLPPFPSYTFTFDPQPYILTTTQIIRTNALKELT